MIPFSDKLIISSYFHSVLDEDVMTLLPVDHARAFPLSFNLKNKKILNGSLNFYNKPFFSNFNPKQYIDPKNVTRNVGQKKFDKIAVINILDNCHGHALLKLFFANKEAYLNKEVDYLLVIPRSLFHFLKGNVFTHVLVVNLSYSDMEACYILNDEVDVFTKNYKYKFLFPIDTYGTLNREKLLSHLNLFDTYINTTVHRITFYYRNDFIRKWQGHRQFSNIINLFKNLKQLVSDKVIFTIVGNKDAEIFPEWIDDKRVSGFSVKSDFMENGIYAQSKILIALTGSHMLIPSVLSNCTIHLHPSYKYKNVAEDVVSFEFDDTLIHSYKHLYYYGNANCSDISPNKLTYLIASHYLGLLEKTYKLTKTQSDQETWIKEHHNYFLFEKVSEYRKNYIAKGQYKVRLLYYLDRIFSK